LEDCSDVRVIEPDFEGRGSDDDVGVGVDAGVSRSRP
jgi:hypothetical protein